MRLAHVRQALRKRHSECSFPNDTEAPRPGNGALAYWRRGADPVGVCQGLARGSAGSRPAPQRTGPTPSGGSPVWFPVGGGAKDGEALATAAFRTAYGAAVAAADKGAWPLVGALVLELATPGVLIRPEPKERFVANGDHPALGDTRWRANGSTQERRCTSSMT